MRIVDLLQTGHVLLGEDTASGIDLGRSEQAAEHATRPVPGLHTLRRILRISSSGPGNVVYTAIEIDVRLPPLQTGGMSSPGRRSL